MVTEIATKNGLVIDDSDRLSKEMLPSDDPRIVAMRDLVFTALNLRPSVAEAIKGRKLAEKVREQYPSLEGDARAQAAIWLMDWELDGEDKLKQVVQMMSVKAAAVVDACAPQYEPTRTVSQGLAPVLTPCAACGFEKPERYHYCRRCSLEREPHKWDECDCGREKLIEHARCSYCHFE